MRIFPDYAMTHRQRCVTIVLSVVAASSPESVPSLLSGEGAVVAALLDVAA